MELSSKIAKASAEFGETNDCTVRALAVALGGDYAKAHYIFASIGRTARKGTYQEQWIEAFRIAGFALDNCRPWFTSLTAKTLADELPRNQTFVIRTHRHLAGFDGAKFVDHVSGRRHQVKELYHVRKLSEPMVYDVNNAPQQKTEDAIIVRVGGKYLDRFQIMFREADKVRHLQDIKFDDFHSEASAYRRAIAKAENTGWKRNVSVTLDASVEAYHNNRWN